jgi:hypothetical protein
MNAFFSHKRIIWEDMTSFLGIICLHAFPELQQKLSLRSYENLMWTSKWRGRKKLGLGLHF